MNFKDLFARLGRRTSASQRIAPDVATPEATTPTSETTLHGTPDEPPGTTSAGSAPVSEVGLNLEGATATVSNMLAQAADLRKGFQTEAAILVYDEIVRQFSGAKDPPLRRLVHEALERRRGSLRGVIGRTQKLIDAHDALLRHYAEAPEQGLEARIIEVLLDKAILLETSGRGDVAQTIFREIDDRFSGNQQSDVREQVAIMLRNKSASLDRAGKLAEARDTFEELLRRFSTAPEPAIQQWLAPAIASPKNVIAKQERAVFIDGLVQKYKETQDPELRHQVAEVLLERAYATDFLNRIQTLDQLLAFFSESEESSMRLRVAKAISCKAGTLIRAAEFDPRALVPATLTFTELLTRFAEAPETEIRAFVAYALLWRARDPVVRKRAEDVLGVLDDLLRRYGSERDPEIEVTIAEAMLNRATALGKLGREPEQLAALDGIFDRFLENKDPRIRKIVARTFVAKTELLHAAGLRDEEFEWHGRFLERFPDETDGLVREHLTDAYWGRAQILVLRKEPRTAIVALEAMTESHTKHSAPMRAFRRAEYLSSKAQMLELLGENAAALTLYRELLTLHETARSEAALLKPLEQEADAAVTRLTTRN